MTTQQETELSHKGDSLPLQGIPRGHRVQQSEHAQLQTALWLAARAAIVNGKRRREERLTQTALADSVAPSRQRHG